VIGEWSALLLRSFQSSATAAKSPWSVVFRDALLRRLTLRFILCRAALTLHTLTGRNPAHLPTVFPELPKEVRRQHAGSLYRLLAMDGAVVPHPGMCAESWCACCVCVLLLLLLLLRRYPLMPLRSWLALRAWPSAWTRWRCLTAQRPSAAAAP
jgi:hypothetical protein